MSFDEFCAFKPKQSHLFVIPAFAGMTNKWDCVYTPM